MAKAKTATATAAPTEVEALTARIAQAISDDVEKNTTAKQSGSVVASTFDEVFAGFNWITFKGNKGAEKCGLSASEYKLVKATRDSYRDAWNDADLPNFDQRWQYVTECSEHYVAPESDDEPRGKSTDAKLEEAVRAVLRHATTNEDEVMIDYGNQMCDYLGLEIKEVE
jgi:uncharacterized protein YbaA (DUF1428 family)